MQKFSVLMSIYYKEKPEYARECFESLLGQTVLASEWVIVEDGPLTDELYAVLDEYQAKYPELLKRVPLAQNVGLGMALREGILHCSNEIVARMDTDDIARYDRFEKQLEMFEKDPTLDVCSSHIKEFIGTVDNIVSERRVPLDKNEIAEYQKRRDSFNHMAVMYKKSAVLKAGNYQHAPLMEDSLLWVNMLKNNAVCGNVDDYLAFARVGADLYKRRGGFKYFLKYRSGRKQIYKTGYISWFDYMYTLVVQFVVALMPNFMRKWVFTKLLRR